MKIGIAGWGKVGSAIGKLLASSKHEIFVVDPVVIPHLSRFKFVDKLPEVDFMFICVPTPKREDGSCDTSIVEGIIANSTAFIYIVRSTVWVGFTDWVASKYQKRVVFMPEYGPSEFPNHPFNDLAKVDWAIVGGYEEDVDKVSSFWESVLYNVKVLYTDSKTAELTKLVENAYFYAKVSFFQQIYDISKAVGVRYDTLRELLTEDPRIEADHSFVFPDSRKVGGACLPKDMANLITLAKKNKVNPEFLETLVKLNNERK